MFGNNLLLTNSLGYDPFALSITSFLNAKVSASVILQTGVSQWTDLKNTNSYTQSVTNAQPSYNLTGMENAPAVQFDGVDDNLRFGNHQEGVFTRWFIVKLDAPNAFLFETINEYIWAGSGSTFEVSRGGVISGKNLPAGWLNNNKTKIVMWRFDGTHAGHQIWVNGVQKTATNTGNTGNPGISVPAASTARIGSRVSGTSNFTKGFISCFLDRPVVLDNTKAKTEFDWLLSTFVPLAKLDGSSNPILDANGDLTY